MNKKFRREDRLGKSTSVIIEKGKRVSAGNIVLYFKKEDCPKLAVVVGRKVGNSVLRNKLKRWAREIFRENKTDLEKYGIVLIFKPGAHELTFSDAKQAIEDLWKKLGIIREQ